MLLRSASTRRAVVACVLAALLVTVACGGDDEPDGADVPTDETAPDPLDIDQPEPGEGVAVIGVETLTFEVTDCSEEPDEDGSDVSVRELLVAGEGEVSDGPFRVEITRYRSDTGVGDPVLTEAARVTFGTADEGDTVDSSVPVERIGLEARRTTGGADGAWLDLTDPTADGPLISRTGDSVDVEAIFGPDRARAGDEGLVEGRVRATCPA